MGRGPHRRKGQSLPDLRSQPGQGEGRQIHARSCVFRSDPVSSAGKPMNELNARAIVGNTNLSVPRVGIGTAPLGNMFHAHTDAEADAVLASAAARGLRYFDTAPLYGHGLAEQPVGRAVAGLPRADGTVSTKGGRVVPAAAPP